MSYQHNPPAAASVHIPPARGPFTPDYPPPLSSRSNPRKPLLRGRTKQLLVAIASSLLWMVSSSALIISNKELYDGLLPYPMTVTGLGQLSSAIAAWLLSATGTICLRSRPPLRFFLCSIGPVIVSTAATMFFGNAAYLYLSLAFIQVLKAATPAITLVLGLSARVETVTPPILAALTLITGGTGAAVLLESGAPSFSWYGLFLFLVSCCTEAARVVWSQVLLGPNRYNSSEVLMFVNAPSGVLLLAAGALLEGPKGMWAGLSQTVSVNLRGLLLALLCSTVVNLSSYLAIAATGSLTFKVVGCVKNVGVVLYGAVVYGDHVSARQWLAYGVSMAGFALYTQAKAVAPPPKPKPSGAGAILGKLHST